MKKMTCAEFKKILSDAGCSTNYEDILNYIAGYMHDTSIAMSEKYGIKTAADKMMEVSDTVYKALDARGYYDDVLKEIGAKR